MLKLKLQFFGHLMQRAGSFEKTLMLRKRAGGEGDNRRWDSWMASPTPWTWVWVNSRSRWWTGRPGVLRFMGSQSQTWLSDWTGTGISLLRFSVPSRFNLYPFLLHCLICWYIVVHSSFLWSLYCCGIGGNFSICIAGFIFLDLLSFFLMCMSFAQSYPTLRNPMDCSPPGSSVHGILQARVLEWVAIPSPEDLSDPGIKPGPPALQADSLPSKPPQKPPFFPNGSV